MKIEQAFTILEGEFDTEKTHMVCVKSDKYQEVQLCLKTNEDKGWNVPIAKIRLYDRDRFQLAKQTYESASKLGDEIARRWNSFITEQ